MAHLTEDQKKAVDNYSNEIVTIEDDIEAIRKLTGMYISSLNNGGFLTIFREIFQNSIDQIVKPNSPCTYINVVFNEATYETVIEDNGLGIPFNDIIRVFTQAHTSKNYDKQPGDYPSGLNGIGAKCTNAYSRIFVVESYNYNGKAAKMEFHEGHPIWNKPKQIPNPNKINGTKIYFTPSDILGTITVTWQEIFDLVRSIAALTPLGTQMHFGAIDKNGKKYSFPIVNDNGIVYFLEKHKISPIIKPIEGFADTGYNRIHFMFTYNGNSDENMNGADVQAYCNFCPIIDPGSTNIVGCLKGISSWFCDYMNKIYMAKSRAKFRVKPIDVEEGLALIIDTSCLEPVFTGQAKGKLSNVEMIEFCKSAIISTINEWQKSNPNDLQKIAKYLYMIAESRAKHDKDKDKIRENYVSSSFTGMPKNYSPATGKKNLELFICEGLSAKGPIVKARDTSKQSIFPIRGKIISAFSHPFKTVFENEEVQAITKIIFGEKYRPDFTIEDCKFEKIIFANDFDADGFHIASLLLQLFIKYFPFLIEAGRVYNAQPPLYMVKNGKKKTYFLNNAIMVKESEKIFKRNNTVTVKGKKISDNELQNIFLKNIDYVYEMDSAAINHGYTAKIMEIVLLNKLFNNDDFKTLQKMMKNHFRFCEVDKAEGINVVKISDDKLYTIYCTEELYSDCKRILEIMNKNSIFYFEINGEKASLYDLMLLFKGTMPSNVSRFKGLGEMNWEDLAESAILPDGRTLVRYTVQDIKEAYERIRQLASDKKLILDYVGTVNRDDLIGV